MFLFRFIGDLITVTAWGLAGNWVGEKFRQQSTAEPGHQLRLFHTNKNGELVIAANPLITNLAPALLLGLMIRPRWLSSFIVGAISSTFLGERSDRAFYDRVKREDD